MSKIYAFDLDDTLCYREPNVEHYGPRKYEYCHPIQENIDKLNKLYNEGNIIYIYTARGMKQYNGDITKVYNNLFNLTLDSLNKWGIKHHGLIMGKIHYDIIVDDKSINLDQLKNI